MELCIDIGNTTIEFGFYENDKIVNKSHIKTDLGMEEHDFISYIVKYCHEHGIIFDNVKDIVYSSVVPEIDDSIFPTLKKVFPYAKVLSVNRNMKFSYSIGVKENEEIGSDLLAGLEGIAYKYGYPSIVCDLGTATKILVLDKSGCFYTCAILTGMDASAEFLFSKASKLPLVSLDKPKNLLKADNTVDAMICGITYGHVGSVTGICQKYDEELGYKTKHVITGGSTHFVEHLLDDSFIVDYDLVLDGLHHLHKNN